MSEIIAATIAQARATGQTELSLIALEEFFATYKALEAQLANLPAHLATAKAEMAQERVALELLDRGITERVAAMNQRQADLDQAATHHARRVAELGDLEERERLQRGKQEWESRSLKAENQIRRLKAKLLVAENLSQLVLEHNYPDGLGSPEVSRDKLGMAVLEMLK